MKPSPKSIKIVEVGPRDGLQNEKTIVSTADKITYIKKLIESGLENIELTSFVNPKNIPQLFDAKEVIEAIDLKPTYSALVPNIKGLERALETKIKRIAIFTAASETFNKKNINMTIEESIKNYKPVVKLALEKGLSVRGYISTCFICPFDGKVNKEKVLEVTNELLNMGVDEVSIGDTIGSALPNDIYETVGFLLNTIPKEKIALHFHDTYNNALVNVAAGIDLGITTFDSSSGGIGGCPYAPGASGNLATEDLVNFLNTVNVKSGVDLNKLTEASMFMKSVLGRPLNRGDSCKGNS
jgi:hydroxymethylglutaryl-CoA lyase